MKKLTSILFLSFLLLTISTTQAKTLVLNVGQFYQLNSPMGEAMSSLEAITLNIGQVVNFVANFTDPAGNAPYTYLWNLGDGNTSTGKIAKAGKIVISHAFNQAGVFTVTIEITDSKRNTIKVQLTVNVIGSVIEDPCDTNVPTVRSRLPWGLWDYPSTWDTGVVPSKDDWVLIQGAHNIILPNSTDQISVKGLCIAEKGVLQSAFNTLITPSSTAHLAAATIHNHGTIQGAYGINGSTLNGIYRHATAGSDIKIYANRFVNDTTGKILARGRGGDDLPYLYLDNWGSMSATGGHGGSVEISPVVFINHGLIQGGDGGIGDTFQDGTHLVDGNAQGGQGGLVRVFATNLAISTNGASGQLKGGAGGYADGIAQWLRWLTVNRRWSWQFGGAWRSVIGGRGGNVSANLGNIAGIIKGNNGNTTGRTLVLPTIWIRIDPTTLTVDNSTHFSGAENIVLFGGDNWIMDLRQLSEGAITAGKTITLAVGRGGVIDLRTVSNKVFVATDKVEIFADRILLDTGVTLADLADAPSVVTHPSKILYHVELSHAAHLVGEPRATVPIKLTLLNSGPTVDTYNVAVTDSAGWPLGTFPATVTVNSMRHSDVAFNVTLPATRGAEDNVTVTVTSRGDPNIQAVANIRVGVMEKEIITPRGDEKADVTLVIENTNTMAGVFLMVSNALETWLINQFGQENSPTDEEVKAFLEQFDEETPPNKAEIQAFLKQFETEDSSSEVPIFELLTFTDEVVSRLVTNDIGEIMGRIRSLQPAGGGDCPNASVAALESALSHISPHGQVFVVTASPPHQAAVNAITQAQEKEVKAHVILTGTCGNEEADKALYKNIADETGGTFQWLPKGETPAAEIEEVISTAVNDGLTEVVEMVKKRDAKLAVRLDDFTATAENGFITLKWTTGAEINSAGFHLWRAEMDQFGAYINLTQITTGNLIPAQGESYNSIDYSHRDEAVSPNTTYYYALEEVDNNGQSAYHLDRIVSATTE